MQWNDVFFNTFQSIGREIGLDVQMVEGYLMCTPLDPDDPRYSADFILPSMKMVEVCRADNFDFFRPWIEAGKITEEQMHRAAERYYLGKTKSGQTIFWMIDDMQDPLDARIGDEWISMRLKKREDFLKFWRPRHCLFGLHLVDSGEIYQGVWPCDRSVYHGDRPPDTSALRLPYQGASPHDTPVAVVESEASAVVLSEIFPESIWMAYATIQHLTPALFAPLEGRTVTIYPRTDPTLSNYLFFEDLAVLVRKDYDIDLTVDSTLEDHASPSQKERCIDILEFLQDSLSDST